MLNLKNEKGSITLFVLASFLFFIASVACVQMFMQSKKVATDREYRDIKASYERDIANIDTINDNLMKLRNLKIEFGSPIVENSTITVMVSFLTDTTGLDIKTIKYGWIYSDTEISDLSSLSSASISDWAFVENVEGSNEFPAVKNNIESKGYYYLCVMVNEQEVWMQKPVIVKSDVIDDTTSYEGYYADIDADGTVDGVIYADLMAGATSGTWSTENTSTYSYTAITEAKDYYVSQDSYTNDLGTNPVLSPVEGTTGNDRFYVMALEDFTTSSYSTFYWYYSADGTGMSDYSTYTSTDFGTGNANTTAMITKWNNSGYGSQNAQDLWGLIQTKVNEGWFIPSKDEWSACGAKLGITTSNYSSTFGLNDWGYWSSSQKDEKQAWFANPRRGQYV